MSLLTKLISGGIHPAQPSAAQNLVSLQPSLPLLLTLSKRDDFHLISPILRIFIQQLSC